jgi:hypothetical protein
VQETSESTSPMVIEVGNVVTLTTGGLDDSTEGKRDPYD